jgi:N-carbamoyl-L-amino-acid hydrolase
MSAERIDTASRYALRAAVQARMELARDVFARLRCIGVDGPGITRAPYGEHESAAHCFIRETGASLGLATRTDHAQNSYVTLPGSEPTRGTVLVGSHLDSVVCGGNYDGAAGVVAGLTVVAAMQDVGFQPDCDITVMGIRAEEGDWFGLNHVGTRAALGLLTARELDAQRADTARKLAEHMVEAGCDLAAIRSGARALDPAALTAFFELHIEQGPVLAYAALPIGVVTAVRGSVRSHAGRCLGSYAHSGAVPMHLRQDAVVATTGLVHALREEWRRIDAEGGDLVLTFGKLYTDHAVHQLSKVPGEVRFTIDARSIDRTTLDRMAGHITSHAARIARESGTVFDLGKLAFVEPVHMTESLVEDLVRRCGDLGIASISMASGAGHDAADFARASVPTAMVFVRNFHGSHNPAEDMSLADFSLATELLADAVAAAAGSNLAVNKGVGRRS